MSAYLNAAGIPLSLAVFLATDNYDYSEDPTSISATALLKPIRQLILSARVPPEQASVDIADMIPSRMGSAIHDAIERSWTVNHAEALKKLGYPAGLVKRVKINPNPDELAEGDIPVYLEQRTIKEFMGYRISGKFDFVGEGRLEDFKSTSVFTWINHTNDDKHIRQGSIYRWLNPKLVTSDEMSIQYIFTDWSSARARAEAKYPPKRVMERRLTLLSIPETEAFIRQKLTQLNQYRDAPEKDLPLCTDEDLWRKEPVFKYYKNPNSTGRSTKNFDTKQEAMARFYEDGGVGKVVEKPGEVTACKFCPAFPVCTQKDALIAAGDLQL